MFEPSWVFSPGRVRLNFGESSIAPTGAWHFSDHRAGTPEARWVRRSVKLQGCHCVVAVFVAAAAAAAAATVADVVVAVVVLVVVVVGVIIVVAGLDWIAVVVIVASVVES